MVLNNVTKVHKILIKTIQLREQSSFGVTYVRIDRITYGRMDWGNTFCPSHCHSRGIINWYANFDLTISCGSGVMNIFTY